MTYYDCPVCGYDRLSKPPKDYYICPSCGTEFESDDFDRSYQELRREWIEKDMPWFDRSTLQPKDWNSYRQLIIADYGGDLTAHPRFMTDLDYRSEINKAFCEVRMGKQLKVLRESRKEPLTQLQLAEKAEPAMKQSRISELEGMNYSSWSISTIERLARALGVGVKYSFAGWGELVPEIAGGLSPAELLIPSFEDDPAFRQKREGEDVFAEALTRMFKPSTNPAKVIPFDKYFKPSQQNVAVPESTREHDPLKLAASGK